MTMRNWTLSFVIATTMYLPFSCSKPAQPAVILPNYSTWEVSNFSDADGFIKNGIPIVMNLSSFVSRDQDKLQEVYIIYDDQHKPLFYLYLIFDPPSHEVFHFFEVKNGKPVYVRTFTDQTSEMLVFMEDFLATRYNIRPRN